MNNANQNVLVDVPVIVLAGGLGSRLKSVVSDRPKILAEINGEPFLAFLLNWLVNQGVTKVCFSLGYMGDLVVEQLMHYKNKQSLEITYVIENEPLGTLGGLSLALAELDATESIVMNGDTFVDVNLARFFEAMELKKAAIGLVATQVENVSRYGQLLINGTGQVTKFIEKDILNTSEGWVNAGVYYFSGIMVNKIKKLHRGSIEYDFLIPYCEQLQSFQIPQCNFIDIGTPESYQRAPFVLQEYIK